MHDTMTHDTMTFSVVPLDAPLGAEIRGIDGRRDIDAATIAELMDAWHKHQVLLFRDQKFTEDELIRFGRHFGRLWVRPARSAGRADKEEVLLITNLKADGKFVGTLAEGDMTFHQDNVFRDVPAIGTMLYAVAIPSRGGETLFANCYAAYEALPQATKRRLDGVRAVHAYDYGVQHRVAKPGAETAVHPAVITHPATGRKALYVNRLMTQSLQGMSRVESDALLEELFEHVEKPEFFYEHSWRVGDLVIWDNWCTMHARRDFPADELRLMWRLTLESDRPPAA